MDPIQWNQDQANPSNMPQPAANIPQQTPNTSASLEDFIRQNAGIPPQPQQQPSWQQFFGGVTPTVNVKVEQPAIIEKVVYKKQRVHWFFRTLTILALLIVWFLMLAEVLWVFKLNLNWFNFSLIYPVFIILSSIIIWSYKWILGKIFGLLLFLIVFVWFGTLGVYSSLNPSTNTKFWAYVSYPKTVWMKSSKIYLETLVTNLNIQGKQTDNLVEWNYAGDRTLLINSGVVASWHDYLILKEDNNWNLIQNYYNNISFGINQKQPTYIYVKNLLSIEKIDLSNITWSNVKLYGWASILDLTLWANVKSWSEIIIESAFSDITLHLSKNVWVKLNHSNLAGQLNLVDFTQKDKWIYESTNIKDGKATINITIKLGVGRVNVIWND